MKDISVAKKMGRFMREIQEESKPQNCILCGRTQTSFCNSHSIPRAILKNIAKAGMVCHANVLIGLPYINDEKGVANSGTFHYICNDCDNRFFKDYEDINALLAGPNDKIMAEIALKDIVHMLSKRNQEKLIYKKGAQRGTLLNQELMEKIQNLDIRDYMEELDLYKSIIEKDTEKNFKVLIWERINYTVPIAAQTLLALPKDINGVEINDIYDMNPNVRMQYMHLGAFPLEGESIIYAFYHRKDKKYRKLYHQLNSMELERKLELINYWIIKYTENYFLSPNVVQVVGDDKELMELSKDNNGYPNLGYVSAKDMMCHREEIKANEITNLLLEKYSIGTK